MAVTSDPTRTRGIEKRWRKDINRRFRQFVRETQAELMRLNKSPVVINASNLSAEQIRVYMAFYQRKIDELLVVTKTAPNWQAQYQIQSYEQAIAQARVTLRAQGVRVELSAAEMAQAALLQGDFAMDTPFGSVAGASPFHAETIEFITTRSYEAFKGWTDQLARDARIILTNGVQEGRGIRGMAKDLRDRADVTKSRSWTIARTETIQAYQHGSVNEALRLEQETGEEIGVRWVTAADGRVRELHAHWHGTVTSPEDGRKRFNISPFNCRCSLTPVVLPFDNEKQTKRFEQEREQLISAEKEKVA